MGEVLDVVVELVDLLVLCCNLDVLFGELFAQVFDFGGLVFELMVKLLDHGLIGSLGLFVGFVGVAQLLAEFGDKRLVFAQCILYEGHVFENGLLV